VRTQLDEIMQRTRIKICGVRDVATARAAVEAGADAVGLVFVDGSPRQVTVEQAKQIVASLPAFVQAVGLFADAPAKVIHETCDATGLHCVQLHGRERPELLRELRGLSVIKALPFEAASFAEVFEPWRAAAEQLAGIIWDTPPRGPGDLRGGSGHTLDWAALSVALRGVESPVSILAGGLTPENVGQAIAVVQPFAVDVSSGVESSRGVKDAGKIRAFCEAVRGR
jgi:phosphoribosylanthranilate isomerase